MKNQLNEVKRMQQLAGVISENLDPEIYNQIHDKFNSNDIDNIIELVLPLVERIAKEGKFDEQDVLKYIFDKVKSVI